MKFNPREQAIVGAVFDSIIARFTDDDMREKWTSEEKRGAAWIALAALLLTFGDALVDVFLRALGL